MISPFVFFVDKKKEHLCNPTSSYSSSMTWARAIPARIKTGPAIATTNNSTPPSLERLRAPGRALYRCTHAINRLHPHALCPPHRTLLLAHTTQTQSRLWSPLSAAHRKRTPHTRHHPQRSRISHGHLGKMARGPDLHKIRWLTRRGMGRRRRAPTPDRLPRRTRL